MNGVEWYSANTGQTFCQRRTISTRQHGGRSVTAFHIHASQVSNINRNKGESATVYRTFEDGYVVRAMTPSDIDIVIGWYSGVGSVSNHDLATALAAFPPGPGFYIGELDGEVVASAIRIPWSDRVFYGAFYYVAKTHRRRGYGTRLRDQVAREHVGDHILAIDAALGKVADDDANKFDYVPASFLTRHAQVVVRDDVTADAAAYRGSIIPVDEVSFDRLIAYDDLCFIGSGNPVRVEFGGRASTNSLGHTLLDRCTPTTPRWPKPFCGGCVPTSLGRQSSLTSG
ncbi:hypothetical protein LSAT2_009682 [Lamellibrachia satsuma]|nr:hypothetical protein LSAT2_009682 [Lamellibrachia satsuma]